MEIFTASWVIPVSAPPLSGGAVAVREGTVVAVGPRRQILSEFSGNVVEFPGCAIVPGLVNAHSHLELTHFPSWRLRKGVDYTPRTFVDWIIQVIKIRKTLTAGECEHSLREGLRISLESGTAMLGEILTDFRLAALYSSSLLRGILFFEAVGQDPERCRSALENLRCAVQEQEEGGFLAGLSPHTPFTISAGFGGSLAELAAAADVPLAIHVAESPFEPQFLAESAGPIADILYPYVHWEKYIPPPRGMTPVRYLDSLGLLTPRTLAVHCVHVGPTDAELLAKRGASICLCPRSNDRLDVGTAPAGLFRRAGIRLALGTDSLASNDSLSMFDEMRFLLERSPQVFSPEELLEMATAGGAQALGLQGGYLAPGVRADFVVVQGEATSGSGIVRKVVEEGSAAEVFLAATRLSSP